MFLIMRFSFLHFPLMNVFFFFCFLLVFAEIKFIIPDNYNPAMAMVKIMMGISWIKFHFNLHHLCRLSQFPTIKRSFNFPTRQLPLPEFEEETLSPFKRLLTDGEQNETSSTCGASWKDYRLIKVTVLMRCCLRRKWNYLEMLQFRWRYFTVRKVKFRMILWGFFHP